MRDTTRKQARWLLAAGAITLGGVIVYQGVHTASADSKGSATAGGTKTVCVGRFLIDLPVEAMVTISKVRLSGFEIAEYQEGHANFIESLSQREKELATSKNVYGRDNIELRQEIANPELVGRIFVHGRQRLDTFKGGRRFSYDAVAIEGYVNSAGRTYSFIAEQADPARIHVLAGMMKQVRAKPDNEPAQMPGFCLGGAVIKDPFEQDRDETVALFAGLPTHRDLRILFWSNAASLRGAGLVQRNVASMDPFLRVRTRMLREGARTINNLLGEEIGLKTTELNLSSGFSFAWESPGHNNHAMSPYLTFEMDSGLSPRVGGKPVESSLSEDAMLKLWDKISSSIRLRAQHE